MELGKCFFEGHLHPNEPDVKGHLFRTAVETMAFLPPEAENEKVTLFLLAQLLEMRNGKGDYYRRKRLREHSGQSDDH